MALTNEQITAQNFKTSSLIKMPYFTSCKDMTLEDWNNAIYYLNPNMKVLNKKPPLGNEFLVCQCSACAGIVRRKPERVKDNIRRKQRTGTATPWCPICSGYEVVAGINDLNSIRPDLSVYFKDKAEPKKVSLNSNKRVELVCPACHHEKKLKVQDLVNYGFNCKNCNASDSYPNKFCRILMSMLPVEEYEPEFSQSWTQGKRYDGYFKYRGEKYLLEFDGRQHFIDTTWSTKEFQQSNDSLKTQIAEANGYKLIRIDCRDSSFQYIREQVCKSELSEVFDLSSVNWDALYEKASVGTFREIVDFYKNHELTNAEIARQLGYNRWTVETYLKKAQSLGMIDYSSHRYVTDFELLRDLCSFFMEHQDYSNKKLAKKYNVSTARVYNYLRIGIEMEYIDISKLTEQAFRYNRFSDIRQNMPLRRETA